MGRTKILILDAQAVQTLIIAEQLYKNDYEVHLFCDSKLNYGYYTKYARKRLVAPSIESTDLYLPFLKDYLEKENIEVVIPMTDASACFLSYNKKELKSLVSFLIPDQKVFDAAYDKNQLMNLCKRKGYPHPKSLDLDKIDYSVVEENDINFPALIKPNFTCGGRGMTLVHTPVELRQKYPSIKEQYGSCNLQEFILSGGKQIKVQLFIDPKTKKEYSSVIYKQRYYPETGGSSCCNITIDDNEVVKICSSVLKDIGWFGFADFDLIEDPSDKTLKIMEINPRIPACIKSAVNSGVDYATLIAEASLGNNLRSYKYSSGHKLRHIGFEFLWFIYSKNRFKAEPNWFNFWGKKLSFQDFSCKDPIPFFMGTLSNIKKQLNPEFRNKKSGVREN